MEPPSTPAPQLEQKHALFRVTPVSKYLAMLLFILMPFIGWYLGYVYAPDKVVEVEKVIIKSEAPNDTLMAQPKFKAVDDSNAIGGELFESQRATDTKISRTVESFVPKRERYEFTNGHYRMNFVNTSYLKLDEFYQDPTTTTLSQGMFQGIFARVIYDESVDPPVSDIENVMGITIHKEEYCHLERCSYPTKAVVSIGQREWEYIGETNYCDVGHCSSWKHAYRSKVGSEYIAYLLSETRLDSSEIDPDIQSIITTLSIEAL